MVVDGGPTLDPRATGITAIRRDANAGRALLFMVAMVFGHFARIFNGIDDIPLRIPVSAALHRHSEAGRCVA